MRYLYRREDESEADGVWWCMRIIPSDMKKRHKLVVKFVSIVYGEAHDEVNIISTCVERYFSIKSLYPETHTAHGIHIN